MNLIKNNVLVQCHRYYYYGTVEEISDSLVRLSDACMVLRVKDDGSFGEMLHHRSNIVLERSKIESYIYRNRL
jgi:hypothetical protein